MRPIGRVRSVYRLCVGTPRQGALAPHSRGRVELFPHRVSSASVTDLDRYSHVWVVFVFHLNSNANAVERSRGTSSSSSDDDSKIVERQFPARVAPPALGGKRRVGVLATRSPHRPNPIGVSLCRIERVVVPPKRPRGGGRRRGDANETPYYVDVRGLDLVDGTPVLDVKPYVPDYDSAERATTPDWVRDGLNKRRDVRFTVKADEQLRDIVATEELEFYGTSTGRDASNEDALRDLRECVAEVLSVDVRSRWQTSKARKGKSKAQNARRLRETDGALERTDDHGDGESNVCTQQLDRLLIEFTVGEGESSSSSSSSESDEDCAVDAGGSGADDSIVVSGVTFLRPAKRGPSLL